MVGLVGKRGERRHPGDSRVARVGTFRPARSLQQFHLRKEIDG
jgi:hypothetical protein